ncbi:MAG: hypothetical protein MJ070_10390 [Lachnospiraceae bacterium]|nr:hypothetical protein [Lachnospiraceae bacterium]
MNDTRKIPMSFRTSLSGYNKDDVNRYIQQMNFQFTRAEEMKNAELERLCKELENCRQAGQELPALKEENERLQTAFENARVELAVAKEEADRKKEEAEALSLQCEAAKAEKTVLLEAAKEESAAQLDALKSEEAILLADKDSRIAALEAEIEALKAENEALKNSAGSGDREQKAQRYEKMSCQLGDILLSANADADRIRETAQENADEIRAKAEKEAAELVEKTNEKLQNEITEAGERLRTAYRSASADCERIIAGLKDSLASADSAMEARTDAFLAGLLNGGMN